MMEHEHRTFTFAVTGMDCAGCASSIQDALPQFAALPDGCSMPFVAVSFADARAVATVACPAPHPEELAAAAVRGEIELQGFAAHLLHTSESMQSADAAPGLASLGPSALAVADGFAEVCPWVLIGIATTVALKWLFSQLQLSVYLSRQLTLADDGGTLALVAVCVKATVLGLVCPLCSCGAVPLAMGLCRTGVSPAAMLAFLLAAQSSGLDSAALTWGVLGARAALLRLVGSSFLAVAAGLAVGRTASASSSCGASKEDAATRQTRSLAALVSAVASICAELTPPLFVGVLLTQLAHPLVRAVKVGWPSLFSTSATMSGPGSSLAGRAIVVAGALPLQVCEHSVVTFARAIEKLGGSPGTAFAFMLVAPATNVATVLLLLRESGGNLGSAQAFRAIGAIIVVAVAMSFLVDRLVEGGDEVGFSTAASSSPAGILSGLCSYRSVRWASFVLVCLFSLGGSAARRVSWTKLKTA